MRQTAVIQTSNISLFPQRLFNQILRPTTQDISSSILYKCTQYIWGKKQSFHCEPTYNSSTSIGKLIMEGLIPFLIQAVRNQRVRQGYRSLSAGSSHRSYHLLLDGEYPSEGSSHRRTRSEFLLPASKRLPVYEFMSPRMSGSSTAAATASDISKITGRDAKGFNNLRHRRWRIPTPDASINSWFRLLRFHDLFVCSTSCIKRK